MPIRPENRARYPADWPAISRRIRFERAHGRCERCGAENDRPHPVTGARVVLTVAHLDHRPENCREENLVAMCQRCHNTYDGPARRAGIRRRRRALLAAGELFGLLLAGCAARPPDDTACVAFRPIYLDEATIAAVPEPLARELAIHNLTWEALCP
jgi:hypothetical protein